MPGPSFAIYRLLQKESANGRSQASFSTAFKNQENTISCQNWDTLALFEISKDPVTQDPSCGPSWLRWSREHLIETASF